MIKAKRVLGNHSFAPFLPLPVLLSYPSILPAFTLPSLLYLSILSL
jgi:hypothetical protein